MKCKVAFLAILKVDGGALPVGVHHERDGVGPCDGGERERLAVVSVVVGASGITESPADDETAAARDLGVSIVRGLEQRCLASFPTSYSANKIGNCISMDWQ